MSNIRVLDITDSLYVMKKKTFLKCIQNICVFIFLFN